MTFSQALRSSRVLSHTCFIITFLLNCVCEATSSITPLPLLSISAEIHRGSVPANNYSFYAFISTAQQRVGGAAIITLHSLVGDADLYVSRRQGDHKPRFQSYDYDLHSATCGFDTVEVDNLSLPVNIGVYGHPSHAVSEFILGILATTSDNATLFELRQTLDQLGVYSEEHLTPFVEEFAKTLSGAGNDYEFWDAGTTDINNESSPVRQKHTSFLAKVLAVLEFLLEASFEVLRIALL